MLFRTFTLNEDAFARQCDARFIYPSKPFRDVYARLLHEIEAGSGALLLIGAPGVGKTTVLRQLGENLAAWTWSVRWGASHGATSQIAASDLPEGEANDEAARPEAGSSSRPMALIVNSADDLSDATLQQICCSILPPADRRAEVLLLAGTEALVDKLACSPHGFAFRLVRMCSLQRDDINAYVRHRLSTAGATSTEVFTTQALDVLTGYSRGVPGTINRIAVASLLLAEVEGSKHVDADLVHEAAADLGIGDPAQPSGVARAPHPERHLDPREALVPPSLLEANTHPITPNGIAVGEAGAMMTQSAPFSTRIPAVHRRRLGAGLAGAAALAALAYFWMQGPPSWLTPDVVSADVQHPLVASSQATAAHDAPVSPDNSGRSAVADDMASLRQPPNANQDGFAANEGAGQETTAATSGHADDGSPEHSMSPADLGDSLAKGDSLTALGDIAAARLYYALASRRGSREATRKLAQSYDPLFLQGARVSGLRADAGKAIAGYRAAAESGDEEAATRLAALLHTVGAEAE